MENRQPLYNFVSQASITLWIPHISWSVFCSNSFIQKSLVGIYISPNWYTHQISKILKQNVCWKHLLGMRRRPPGPEKKVTTAPFQVFTQNLKFLVCRLKKLRDSDACEESAGSVGTWEALPGQAGSFSAVGRPAYPAWRNREHQSRVRMVREGRIPAILKFELE